MRFARLGDLVAELGVRLQPLLVHALEHGHARVDVVVDDDVVLALALAVKAPRVLGNDALEGVRRREHERVQLGQVEALAVLKVILSAPLGLRLSY